MKNALRLALLSGQVMPGILSGGDTTAPTCVLTTAASEPVGTAFSVTATFSESVTGLLAGEINVTNGAASSLAGSGAVYTFTVTPDWAGNITVQIPAGVCQDAATNTNEASNALAVTVDYDHTVSLPIVFDSYVSSVAADTNYVNDTTMLVRVALRTPLIKFNTAAMADGVDIQSATLTLTTATAIGAATLTVYGVKSVNNTLNTTVTWNYKIASTTRWAGDTGGDGGADAGCSVSGTDYLATELGTGSIPATTNTAFATSLTPAQVEAWLLERDGSGYATLRCIQSAATNQTIHSKESATEGYRPTLSVRYFGPPPLA